jgi:hypothetical protein
MGTTDTSSPDREESSGRSEFESNGSGLEQREREREETNEPCGSESSD